ncbi:hypothetical protein [Mycoplasma sp. HS2188]|uniref:hypothetical protein n=1 Tax=Mycoplasma sp. HS2188 TaxID=2976765 RepID=UPI0021AAFF43|nr:hypothetical protein [Mycoplasma sp. HS2188]MCT4469520.1 hypothetical protein [Mycoplasma sp. HS2188]
MKRDYLKITDTNELWSLEKSRFRLFIIGACVSIGLILLTIITKTIVDATLLFIRENSLQEGKLELPSDVLIDLVLLSINIYIAITYYKSISKSYKEKTFEYLDQRAIMFYGIMSFISIINLIFLFTRSFNKNTNLDPIEIASITIGALLIVMNIAFYYGFIKETKFIGLAFANAKAMQSLKNQMADNEELSNMMSQLFGSKITTENDQKSDKNTEDEKILQEKQQKETVRNEKISQLISLPNSKLFAIAEKLYISGYEKMDKEELANLIYDILEKNK